MSEVTSALVAAIIASANKNTPAEKFLREKMLKEHGAVFNFSTQTWELGDKKMSVEMGLFGPRECLVRFLKEDE